MRNKKGFTLIELLIVVVIIGILAAIAIPKFANTKDKAYVAAMKSDLRNLATYEEQYAADNNGVYFSGTATNLSPLQGFTPSQNVTIVAIALLGPPPSWTATATHSQSAKTCSNATGTIVCVYVVVDRELLQLKRIKRGGESLPVLFCNVPPASCHTLSQGCGT
jgi:prepilin-type N-terminal cleavage/methylation domain-containing protein